MAILQKITEITKVREWINIINTLVDAVTLKSYVWETVSEIGRKEYSFPNSTPFPPNSRFIVTYASIELYEDDYVINGNTITFISPTLEKDYPIKIRYIGSR